MSKQSEAKEKMGYMKKAVPCWVHRTSPRTCCNCAYFRMEVKLTKTTSGGECSEEMNLICSVGGFKVEGMATCNAFELPKA